MNSELRSKILLGVVCAYVGLIFYLGSTPRAVVTFSVRAEDKWGHALAFGLMQWSHIAFYRLRFPKRSFFVLSFAAVLSASALGGLLELWQILFPPRSSEFLDWLADTVGAVLFAFVYPKRFVENKLGFAPDTATEVEL